MNVAATVSLLPTGPVNPPISLLGVADIHEVCRVFNVDFDTVKCHHRHGRNPDLLTLIRNWSNTTLLLQTMGY